MFVCKANWLFCKEPTDCNMDQTLQASWGA